MCSDSSPARRYRTPAGTWLLRRTLGPNWLGVRGVRFVTPPALDRTFAGHGSSVSNSLRDSIGPIRSDEEPSLRVEPLTCAHIELGYGIDHHDCPAVDPSPSICLHDATFPRVSGPPYRRTRCSITSSEYDMVDSRTLETWPADWRRKGRLWIQLAEGLGLSCVGTNALMS